MDGEWQTEERVERKSGIGMGEDRKIEIGRQDVKKRDSE